ncbi:hypothetical protein MBH78_20330 [Oceanimonas sp. NS1]|nr:hypothetical protein [Oceanimonas sp. NS1]
MKESIIKRVEIYAVADRNAAHLPWADNQEPLIYTNNLVRLITEDGTEGVGPPSATRKMTLTAVFSRPCAP